MKNTERLYKIMLAAETEHFLKYPSMSIESVACKYMNEHGVVTWSETDEVPPRNGIYPVKVRCGNSTVIDITFARYRDGVWLDLYDDYRNPMWKVYSWLDVKSECKEEI